MEKKGQFDPQAAHRILRAKCQHKGIPEPALESFLSASSLAEAGVYWRQDLADQVPGAGLPEWDVVVHELSHLLADFLAHLRNTHDH
ncbi:MAG: hypothetical protein ACUVR4_13385 [Anaerolineae bacterium]